MLFSGELYSFLDHSSSKTATLESGMKNNLKTGKYNTIKLQPQVLAPLFVSICL